MSPLTRMWREIIIILTFSCRDKMRKILKEEKAFYSVFFLYFENLVVSSVCTFPQNSLTFVSSSFYDPRGQHDGPRNWGLIGPEVGPHTSGCRGVAALGLGSAVSSLPVDVRTHGGSVLLQAIRNRYTFVPGLQYRGNITGFRSSPADYFAPLSL